MRSGTARYIAITCCVLLSVYLVWLGFKTPAATLQTAPLAGQSDSSFDITVYLADARKALPENDKNRIVQYEEELRNARSTQINVANEKLAAAWESRGDYLAAAFYYEQLAQSDKTEASLQKASTAYASALTRADEKPEQDYVLLHLEDLLKKLLEINPGNLQAKTQLAMSYSTNQRNTMQGVQLLREVLQADSNYMPAIQMLGALALESGQNDRAVARFRKLVQLEPQNAEFHVMLGHALEKNGRQDEAEKEYSIARSLAGDNDRKKENIESIINSLKN